MDIAELLNPAVESRNLFDPTDEYISNSMVVVKKLLQAALMLGKHVANPQRSIFPQARGDGGVIWTTDRMVEMQGMTDTELTDYFCSQIASW